MDGGSDALDPPGGELPQRKTGFVDR